MRIAEVRFFTILCIEGGEFLLTLVSLFSKPDLTLLRLSADMLWSCKYHSNSALEFIDIKCIQAVVVMVPHAPAIEGQETQDRWFLVEKPGLDVTVMASAKEDPIRGDDNSNSDLAA